MWCGVVTLFPTMFNALTDHGVTGRAIENQILNLSLQNPRDFATDVHKTVDDRPYGGGPGMVMKVEPLRAAINTLRQQTSAAKGPVKVIALTPQGKRVTQQDIQALVRDCQQVIFVAGRYEGIDERLYALEVDEQWSIGDYVISGGELAAMVIIDAMARLLPGVLGHPASAQQDSFTDGLLDCPHYTRPEVVAGLPVPDVLLSGDHARIAQWRQEQRLERTKLLRPELLECVD
ncbi:MAG TPA: tRNA (guanosine(37)-N1)-methyltransferase TrmD [Gammaproteobacteria bacterium]|nr:tRNA (guanosine(37)-N1)-methyltransferase TrmD [Gammaproteobacteria bacterium]